jgi:hypothetical protein
MRVPFFRVAERKEPKKGRPHCLRPLRFATGQPAVLGFGGVSLELAALRQSRALIRQTLRSSAHPEGQREQNSHTGHRCARPQLVGASATRCANWAEQSDGPNGCPAPHPCWLRLRRGGCGVSTRVAARVLRELTRRSCLNGAPQARSEFCGAPRNRHAAGLPLRTAKGWQTGGRLSFGYFSLAKQRKVPRPPGRLPASALNPDMRPNQHTPPNTTKSIATSAYPTNASSQSR